MTSNRTIKVGLAMVVAGLIGGVLIHQANFEGPEAPSMGALDTEVSPDPSPDNATAGMGGQATATDAASRQQAGDSRPERPYTFSSTADYEAVSAYGQLPHHLQGIRLRKLAYDEEGNLIVNLKVKDLIESFLSASPSGGRAQAVGRIEEYMTMTLPEPASSQALDILEGYLDYKGALSELELPQQGNLDRGSVIARFEQAMAARKRLRREHLSDGVAEAFFPEEAYDDFSLQRMALRADPDLSDEQKQQRIAQLEKELPERIRQRVREKRLQRDVESTVSELKAEGGYEQEVYELRRDFYGKETADRLRYFEDDSPSWQQRVALFNEERAHIEQRQNLSDSEKQARIEAVKASTFSYKEQVKLSVQKISEAAAQVD